MRITRDDDDYEIIDGRRCLKDKRTMRVSLAMKDARRREDEEEDRRRHKVTTYDPNGRVSAVFEHDAVHLTTNTPAMVPGSRPASYVSGALDAVRRENYARQVTEAAMTMGLPGAHRPTHDATPMTFADAERLRYEAWRASVEALDYRTAGQ
jgi:hypothetical protein